MVHSLKQIRPQEVVCNSYISVYYSSCELLRTVCISDLSMRSILYIHMDRSSHFLDVADLSPVSQKNSYFLPWRSTRDETQGQVVSSSSHIL